MKKIFIILMAMLFLTGAGCINYNYQPIQQPAQKDPASATPSTQTSTSNTRENTVQTDRQEIRRNLKTISPGLIITLQIPSNCNDDTAAGTTYIVCPTPTNESPTPEMAISSDGFTVNIKRWEGLSSPYWDEIVSSLRIVTPLTHTVQINIEK